MISTRDSKILKKLDIELKGMVNEAFRKSNPVRRWIDLSNDILTIDINQATSKLHIQRSYSRPIPRIVKIRMISTIILRSELEPTSQFEN